MPRINLIYALKAGAWISGFILIFKCISPFIDNIIHPTLIKVYALLFCGIEMGDLEIVRTSGRDYYFSNGIHISLTFIGAMLISMIKLILFAILIGSYMTVLQIISYRFLKIDLFGIEKIPKQD